MKIVLDTHYLLWCLFDTNKLTEKEKSIILDFDNEIYVSTVSLWEISIKYSLKKLHMAEFKINEIIESIDESGYEIINLESDEAISYHLLPKIEHKDPFDRMIIWQAIKRNMFLLTKDKSIPEYEKYGLKLLRK